MHGEVVAVVPVKPLANAKSRLAVDDDERADLALAFALDAVGALVGCPLVDDVVVVTTDPRVAADMRPLGVRIARDDGVGLDRAIRSGVRAVPARRAVAVVPGDLPCLRPDDVGTVLRAALAQGGAFVPDLAGTGTTFVVQAAGSPVRTRYGDGSADRHRALGLHGLADAPVRARHDVDTLDDLRSAAGLGLGARTSAVLAARDIDLTPALL
ncbi:MAG: 2-phospho-L-lactate guanylyltransferase [Candidatus Nanopelagicales bacterium]